ncbi:MAG: hypothetical protein ABFC96_16640 [Thermoguttaceae bacterium]
MWKKMIHRMACPVCRSETLANTESKPRYIARQMCSHAWWILPTVAAAVALGGVAYFQADLKRYVKMSRM